MASISCKQHIANYISQSTRNRLVFCHSLIEGLSFVNIGKELAESMSQENLRSSVIAYAAEDYLNEIFSKTESDPVIGQYLALCNIAILLEPSLSFNLKTILDNASKNKTVVICSDGIVKSNRFYFLQEGDGVYIDLTGLSFMEI